MEVGCNNIFFFGVSFLSCHNMTYARAWYLDNNKFCQQDFHIFLLAHAMEKFLELLFFFFWNKHSFGFHHFYPILLFLMFSIHEFATKTISSSSVFIAGKYIHTYIYIDRTWLKTKKERKKEEKMVMLKRRDILIANCYNLGAW